MNGGQSNETTKSLDPIAERAKNVFRFLAEVKKLASPTISDFESYDQVVWLSDIPREKGCYTKAWEVVGQPSKDSREAWVEIQKPHLSAPPELPDGLDLLVNEKEWRDSSCEQPSLLEVSREQLIRHLLPDEDTDPEIQTLSISENDDIFEQYVEYVDGPWKEWAESKSKGKEEQDIEFPVPPETLVPWLDSERLHDFTLSEPPLLEAISVEVDTKFQQAKQKLDEDWKDYLNKKWFPWAEEDRRLQRIQKIYNQLYSAYQRWQKLGEQYEIVTGFGLLTWEGPKSGRVRRHVLTAEATIEFDARRGIISVVPPPNGTSLSVEDDMVHSEERPQPAEKTQLDEQAKQSGDLFWDQAILSDLSKSFVNSLKYGEETKIQSSGQFELRLERSEKISERPIVDFAPAVILRKRSQRGFIRLLTDIEKRIEEGGVVPEGIKRVITDPEDLDISSPETDNEPYSRQSDVEIYFPLPANKEQRQIARYIQQGRGVRVQGPPGTGKSHTITNLICHLLATGQRVLVTSETERALRSLRSKFVDAAKPLAELAVILLGNDTTSMLELEKSVSAIIGRREIWLLEGDSKETVKHLESQLDDIRRKRKTAENNLRSLRESDVYVHHQKFGRYSGTLEQIAFQVNAERDQYSWLADSPDPSKNPADVFTSPAEDFVRKWHLWDLRSLIDSEPALTSIQNLPSFETFQDEVFEYRKIQDRLTELTSKVDNKLIDQLRDAPTAEVSEIQNLAYSIVAGLRRIWRELYNLTKSELDKCTPIVNDVSNLEVVGIEDADIRKLKNAVAVLIGYGKQGKKIRKRLFQPKEVKQAFADLAGVVIDGKAPSSLSELEILSKWLITKDALNVLRKNWTGIAAFPPGAMISEVARLQDFMEPLEIALGLHEKVQTAQNRIDKLARFEAPRWHILEDVELFCQTFEFKELQHQISDKQKHFERYVAEAAVAVRTKEGAEIELEKAIKEFDPPAYKVCIEQVEEANELTLEQRGILKIARELRSQLPLTYDRFLSSKDTDLWISLFEQLECAWQWKLTDAWLKELCDPKAAQNLNNDIEQYSSRERLFLGQLAAEKAWSFCMRRLSEKQRQALVAWVQAVEKIRKGTGRHAEKHRRTAREKLLECQSAIPAWVLPLHRVVETVDAVPEIFDVAIIDEASQSGSEALILGYIAKKVIVVGDDKQIRPQTPGINHDDVEYLRKRYLSDVPHSETFDLNGSFFSQAEVRFPSQVTLREHFRCMPEIIQFSNNYFYQASPLIPLKQYGSNRLDPVVPVYVEDGYRVGSSSKVINEPEAKKLVELLAECCSDPKYEDKSMGVITLLGHNQSALIEELLMNEIEAEEYEKRKIVVGSAYAFQGDERDIIFLSMVDSPQDGKRCRAVTSAEKGREFNVAASRAREQMFLLHSASLNDLREDCFQYKLLSHCLNPEAKQLPAVDISINELRLIAREMERRKGNQPRPFESWFELDVFMKLADRGYRVIPQYIVNPYERSYRIDLVVEGLQGRLAVECDGDEWHGPEQYEKDMARQRELERCGWEFWRLRGGAFRLDPEAAMNSLWELLNRRGIFPEGHVQQESVKRRTRDLTAPMPDEPSTEEDLVGPSEAPQEESADDQTNGNDARKAGDLTAKEIQEALLAILQERPNNSIALKAVASELCRQVGVRTRGAPRRELDKRISRSVGVLKRQGLVEEYKAKNVRIRLVQNSLFH